MTWKRLIIFVAVIGAFALGIIFTSVNKGGGHQSLTVPESPTLYDEPTSTGGKELGDIKLSLFSGIDMEEKTEFQFGEQPLYLCVEYENFSENPVTITVAEEYDAVTLHTDYELPGGTSGAVKTWFQLARNIFISEGSHKILVTQKGNPKAIPYETELKITSPKAPIAKEGQIFTQAHSETPFISSMGITDAVTAENVPLNNITDMIEGNTYNIYFTIGKINKPDNLFIGYKLYEGNVSKGEAFTSGRKSVAELFSSIPPNLRKDGSYFQSFIPIEPEAIEKIEGNKLIVELILSDKDGGNLHSGTMSVFLQNFE